MVVQDWIYCNSPALPLRPRRSRTAEEVCPSLPAITPGGKIAQNFSTAEKQEKTANPINHLERYTAYLQFPHVRPGLAGSATIRKISIQTLSFTVAGTREVVCDFGRHSGMLPWRGDRNAPALWLAKRPCERADFFSLWCFCLNCVTLRGSKNDNILL